LCGTGGASGLRKSFPPPFSEICLEVFSSPPTVSRSSFLEGRRMERVDLTCSVSSSSSAPCSPSSSTTSTSPSSSSASSSSASGSFNRTSSSSSLSTSTSAVFARSSASTSTSPSTSSEGIFSNTVWRLLSASSRKLEPL
uniref:REJ domain-containing protein n=1 Tax=Hydatigena taeniaeformis TaxID=6205 RepID=A0A0R3WR20_HYDTA